MRRRARGPARRLAGLERPMRRGPFATAPGAQLLSVRASVGAPGRACTGGGWWRLAGLVRPVCEGRLARLWVRRLNAPPPFVVEAYGEGRGTVTRARELLSPADRSGRFEGGPPASSGAAGWSRRRSGRLRVRARRWGLASPRVAVGGPRGGPTRLDGCPLKVRNPLWERASRCGPGRDRTCDRWIMSPLL